MCLTARNAGISCCGLPEFWMEERGRLLKEKEELCKPAAYESAQEKDTHIHCL